MAKQAVKKGAGIKKGGLAAFKEKNGLVYKPGESKITTSASNADKPMEWITMPKAFQQATMLPGIPQGHVVSVIGHSNVGKSTLINHAMVSAQRQGLIPVYFDTENAFSFKYAVDMGLKADPVWDDVEVEHVDSETGEVSYTTEKQIVNWDGDFLYYNTAMLADQYGQWDYAAGKETSKKRKVAVIEDIVKCMNDLMDAQDNGEIEQGFLFIWDSVGSISGYKAYKSGTGNNMFDAGTISAAFNMIVNNRIPSSKKMSSSYTNTFLYVNKVWMDSMTAPMAPAIMQTKGGKSLKYATRLEILLGGQLTAGTKRLTAAAKGCTYSYAIETKIKILKNHLDAPHNVMYEGPMIACDLGFVAPEDLETYKKEHITSILKELQGRAKDSGEVITEKDITFDAVDSEE